jgi:hypothetical protein
MSMKTTATKTKLLIALGAWVVLYLLATAFNPANPAEPPRILGTADMTDGATIVFYNDAGPICIGPAKRAELVAIDGGRIGACWVPRQNSLAVVFFDGDIGAVPVGALKPPKDV